MSDPPHLRWKGSALVLTLASVVLLTAALSVPRYASASAQIFVTSSTGMPGPNRSSGGS